LEVFMKSLKYIVGMISAAALVIAFAACASAPKLTGTEKIAVVSYTMERSIVRSGERPDPGPGILNSKDEDYYKYHKQAFAQAWAAFKAKAPAIFGPSRLVDFAQVEGNAEILALTVPVSIKLLGQETSVASNLMYPEGLNYCNIMDSKLSTKLAEITKAGLLISVAIKAEYDMSSGIGFGVLSIGNGKMILYATVSVEIGRAHV
jgi:hypothetical protein